MTDRQSNRLSIALLAATVFCSTLALLPPLPAPKARARPQGIRTVNHLAGSSLKLPAIALPATNVPPPSTAPR